MGAREQVEALSVSERRKTSGSLCPCCPGYLKLQREKHTNTE
ncbi:hypothetical protein HMPREF9141_2322 [Prevotella multiformis DSM 16608]|uniref:Uncharacterized protein n=1 Tax=Prevotella multiformis DSM 16608 TaxID=888743 RepID=F0F9Q5_9BACT|nr:hypothetical protein HMPREF9141_2322 [Prevotella multiformis DSM 16608]